MMPEPSKILPRYRELADLLRSDIVKGVLKPGDQLPTEHELCAKYDVSRHTAREALRLLSEDGLIARRRRAGTVVADVAAPAFAQAIGDYDSILQYARDVRFELQSERLATDAELGAAGLNGAFLRFEGVRRQDKQPPLAVTRIFVLSSLAPDAATLRGLDTSLSEWIERTHDVPVHQVVQRMEAVALKAQSARKLGLKAGAPALSTERRYFDGAGRIILYSQSLHPAGRFVYEMRLDRKRRPSGNT